MTAAEPRPPPGYASGYVSTGEVDLHVVRTEGNEDGEPVVLLHGFPEFWYGWRGQLTDLADAGYDVIVPDQRGYNRSRRPPDVGAYRIDRLAGDVLGLLDRLGHADASVVGHDWGGLIGWWLAMEHPGRIRRLAVLNAPHPTAFEDALRRRPGQLRRSLYAGLFQLPGVSERLLRAGNYRALSRSLTSISRPGTFGDDELDAYRSAWARPGALTGMLNWYRAAVRAPPRPNASTVVPPTLIVWGLEDRTLLPDLAQKSLERCSDGRLVRFEDATHWLHHECPDRVTDRLRTFLSGG